MGAEKAPLQKTKKRNSTTSPWDKLTVTSVLLSENKPTGNWVSFYKMKVFEQRQSRIVKKKRSLTLSLQ